MRFRVLCLSRKMASGGELLGRALADRLGFRYVDEEIIALAAERARVSAEDLAAIERKPSVMARVLEAIGLEPVDEKTMGGLVREPMNFDDYNVRRPPPAVPPDHRALIRQAIHDVAEQGQVVIVAHAASMALADRTDVLRVMITASPDVRASRLKVGNAAQAIAKDDDGRRDYLRRFYGVERELPTHYDLVVNTDKLTPDDALGIVLAAAQS